MIRKITLENFMSHGTTVIELADGLTVLTGPNNCGKSALVAALQILASNGKSKHVIRHGAKFSRVTVETDDGHTVVWHRKKTTVKYNLNGEDVHRVGQGVPEELPTTLRLDRVTTESGTSKNDYDIHFGEQKSPVFLLNESGSRAAAFFASSSDAARLVEMQHKHRTRTAACRSEAKRLEAESEQNRARLNAFEPIDGISESIKTAEVLQAEIETAAQQQRTLLATISRLRAVTDQVARWRRERAILSALDRTDTTPERLQRTADGCQRLRNWLQSADTMTRTRNLERQRAAALASLLPVPAQHPAAALSIAIVKIDGTQQRLAAATTIATACRGLAIPPEMQPAEHCRRAIAKLRGAKSQQQASLRAANVMLPLTPPPPTHDHRGLGRMIERFREVGGTHARWMARHAITRRLLAPPSIDSTEKLQDTIAALSRAVSHRSHGKRYHETFAPLRAAETPCDPKPIATTLARLTPAITATDAARQAASQAQSRVAQCEQSIREFVLENPKCMTCGGSIDPETLMSTLPEVHSHPEEKPTAAHEKSQ